MGKKTKQLAAMGAGALMLGTVGANADTIRGVDVTPYSDNPKVAAAVEHYHNYLATLSDKLKLAIVEGADCKLFFDKSDPKGSAPNVIACKKATFGVSKAVANAREEDLDQEYAETAQRVNDRKDNIAQLKTTEVVLRKEVAALDSVNQQLEAALAALGNQ